MDIDEIEKDLGKFEIPSDKLLSAILGIELKNQALLSILLSEFCESSDKETELLEKAETLKTIMFRDLMVELGN